jgi:peptidylprolyl isomerase
MYRLALIASLLLFTACKKDAPGSSTGSASEAIAPKPDDKPTGPAPRTGKVDLRAKTTPGQTEKPKFVLPPEANPPGVPVLDGELKVDRDVRYIDEKVGTGPAPVKGKRVEVHYSGWLTDGTKFDASVDRDEPIKFPFDGGVVIKGWDIGLSSMKVGGKRRIIIPADLAYGDIDKGPIPAGSVLVFDVELLGADQ